MNKYILSFIFAVAGLQMVIAQNTTSTEKRDSSYSRILKSTFFQTSESGWVRNGENWLYKDSITTSTPDNYILEETVKEYSYENGIESKNCYKTTTEVSTTYVTGDADWHWHDGKWFHKGKATEMKPTNISKEKREKKSTIQIECDE